MKLLLGILLILAELKCNAQTYHTSPNRDNCISLTEMTSVVSGRIATVFLEDSTQKYFYNYCQTDSFRILFNDSCPIEPLFRNGIINGQILKKMWFHLVYSKDMSNESDLNILIIDETGNVATWVGYYIIFGIEIIEAFSTNQTRVFSLESYSGSGDESIVFYLELSNPTSTNTTSLNEFMQNATVSCLTSWYRKI